MENSEREFSSCVEGVVVAHPLFLFQVTSQNPFLEHAMMVGDLIDGLGMWKEGMVK